MFLKEIDFLSQPITLFNQGSVSHSSLPSGILSIITVVIILILSIREIKSFFKEIVKLQVQHHLHILSKMPVQFHLILHHCFIL